MLKIGIICEQKIPPDSRVPLTPKQCVFLQTYYPLEIWIAPSPIRCYKDEEYLAEGLQMSNDLSHCDILMGVKEVPKYALIANKTYFFFSHTIKKQIYNKELLQEILKKNITLIDYEVLKNIQGERLIAFGIFAGMVGAHNTLWAYAKRTKKFLLPRMKDCHDYAEAVAIYKKVIFPAIKIVLTGTGRVASGAARVLLDMNIKQVSPNDFLKNTYKKAVFTQLIGEDYVERIDEKSYQRKDFHENPHLYRSKFAPFTKVADVMINGIYWHPNSPKFFTQEDMQSPYFKIKVIGDVTCDIAPEASIPSTLFASTIENPVFGYDPMTAQVSDPFLPTVIDVMSIDNLPNELPRDASEFFGKQFINNILSEFMNGDSEIINKGTIAKAGHLTPFFEYLSDYVAL